MELPCVQCGQRLRVPDGLRTVRLRCPACQYIFTTSTYDSSVVEAELAAGNSYASRHADSNSSNAADYDVREYLNPSTEVTQETVQKGAKSGWSVLFFIIMTLLFQGHNIVNFFKAKKKQRPPAAAQPIKQEAGEGRKFGENLPQPKRQSRSKKQRVAPKEVIPAEKPPGNPLPTKPSAEADNPA